MSARDDGYLLDIVHNGRLALSFVADLTREAFLGDPKTKAAVVRQIEIVGEAAKRLSPAFRDAHPDIPLREAAGMRDRLIHDYGAVDYETVWLVITQDLPALLERLAPLLPEQ